MNSKPRGNWSAAGWLVAIAFALLGQFSLSSAQAASKDTLFGVPRDGLLFYAAAAAVFVALVTLSEREALTEGGPGVRWWDAARDWATARSMRIALVVAGFAVAYVLARLLQNRAGAPSYLDAFGLWILAAVLYVAAFLPAPRGAWGEVPAALQAWASDVRARLRAHRVEAALVVAVVLLGGVLRFAALGDIPDVVSGDEGRIGSLGLSAATGEIQNPFATTYGHSTMYLFVEGAALQVFGTHSPFALRFLHALAGALNVLVLYALGRAMFGARVGLVAAFLLAVSHFHLHFSRIIVAGGIMDALLATLAVFLFWYGMKHRRTLSFVAAGLAVGVHLYFYMGGRLVIMFLLAYVVVLYVINPKLARGNIGNFLAFAGAFVVVAVPMALWATTHANDFMARVNQVGIFQTGWVDREMARTGKDMIAILLEQFRDALLIFNYYPATGFYFARLPVLDFYSGAAFIPGLIYALWKTLEPRFLLLHAWFWSALISGGVLLMLTGQGAYRVLILVPVVFLLVALVVIKVGELGRRFIVDDERLWRVMGVAFLALAAFVNLQYYFGEYARSCKYEDGATRLASHMGRYLGTLDAGRYTAYLLTGPTLPASTIHPSWVFLSGEMRIVDVPGAVAAQPAAADPGRGAVFLFLPERFGEETAVRQAYPNGAAVDFYDCGRLVGKAWVVGPP